jgi:hypothetical protein
VYVSTWGLGADRRHPATHHHSKPPPPQHPRLPRFCLEFPMIVAGPFMPLAMFLRHVEVLRQHLGLKLCNQPLVHRLKGI